MTGTSMTTTITVTPPDEAMLVADVGGTNVRLAVVLHDQLHHICLYRADDYDSLQAVIIEYLNALSESADQESGVYQALPIKTGIIDLATPIDQDYVKLTNRPDWAFSVAALRESLDFDWLHVINDFTALALSVPLLNDDDVLAISPKAQSQNHNAGGNIALIGPGTGLGVSGLVETSDGYLPIAGEGGHVTYSGIGHRERVITEHLRERYGHVSAERLLSGNGIENIYQAISQVDGVPATLNSASEITEAAIAESDLVAIETLQHYFSILGTVTGNVALTFGAFAGVYLAGGILPKIESALLASDFYVRFLAHGRFNTYLSQMPIYLVTADQPALVGCQACNQLIYRHLGVFAAR